jgi:hypothetical protein
MVLHGQLELMLSFLRLYAAEGYTEWGKHADIIAKSAGNSAWMSRRLREWSIAFIKDETNLPTSEYGKINGSVLEDEDLAQEIHMHLQGPRCCQLHVIGGNENLTELEKWNLFADGPTVDEADGVPLESRAKGHVFGWA